MSFINPFNSASYSARDSSSKRPAFEKRPCLRALNLLRFFPWGVRGPVDLWMEGRSISSTLADFG